MRTGRTLVAGVVLLAGLSSAVPRAAAMAAGLHRPAVGLHRPAAGLHRPAAGRDRPAVGWTTEQRWSPKNDWEPNIAADPSSPWLYQMTTQYGGPSACRPHMNHCILFRSSANRGTTWHRSRGMERRMCPPGKGCRQAAWQNDPVLAVSGSGVIYAAWMNQWDVVFARSADHGRTWREFHDFRHALGASFTDKPWIAVSPGGRNVYIAFNQSDSYIAASHDYGRTWSVPVRTNTDGRYWFAEGGVVAPDGHVYFAESAEHQNAKGTILLAVISSADGGTSWRTTVVAHSQQQPPCLVTHCPNDFYGAQISLAADGSGRILAAYAVSAAAAAPMKLQAITSANGVSWSAPTGLGSGGSKVGADFPKVAAGPAPGDFAVAWEDDRNGGQAWNVWYQTTRTGGRSWSPVTRVSARASGAPYKSSAGFQFPYGDYFGMTVDNQGTSDLAWSEGTSYDGPGNTWWAHSHWP